MTAKVWLDAKNAPAEGDVLAAWGDALLDTERCRCEPVKVGDVADIVVQRERVLRFAARVDAVKTEGRCVTVTVRDVREVVP